MPLDNIGALYCYGYGSNIEPTGTFLKIEGGRIWDADTYTYLGYMALRDDGQIVPF